MREANIFSDNNDLGSSETTREPPLSSKTLLFHDYKVHCLEHLNKAAPQAFLEWFVGFSEGDGTFCMREADVRVNKLRFLFEIGLIKLSCCACFEDSKTFRVWRCFLFYAK
jgi:hypothetical protein